MTQEAQNQVAPSQETQAQHQHQPLEAAKPPLKGHKENPFKPQNSAYAQRKEAFLASLREERGVAEPAQSAAQPQASQAAQPSVPATGDAAATQAQPSMEDMFRQFEARLDTRQQQAAQLQQQADARLAEAAAKEARLANAAQDPMGFLSELNLSPDEWNNILAGGGTVDPNTTRMKAMEAKLAAMEKQAADQQQAAARAHEDQAIKATMASLPFASKISSPAEVRQKMAQLAAQGRPATAAHAMHAIESELKSGLQNVLQNPEIAAILGISTSNQPSKVSAASPSTLNGSFSSGSTVKTAAQAPAANDWKAKRAAFLELMAKQRG